MWLRVSCDLVFDIEISTPFILMLRPRSGAQQWVERDEFKISPNLQVIECTDGYGNLCQRLVAPPGNFSIYTAADVKTSEFLDVDFGAPFIEIQNLPNDVLCYLLPSRYCESDRFNDLAMSIAGNQLPGFNQVAAIENWLRNTISFIPGSSDIPISAIEVNQKKIWSLQRFSTFRNSIMPKFKYSCTYGSWVFISTISYGYACLV